MSYSILSSCSGCTACAKICPVEAISGQRNAVHVIDSAVCIECGACGRVCPSEAVQDDAGHLCQNLKRSNWLHPVISAKKCTGCGVCLQVCPSSVLDFSEQIDHRVNSIAFLKDAKNCIGCSFCQVSCPVNAIKMQSKMT